MIGLGDFINDPVAFSAGVQAAATIVLVGITAWYARLTKRMADEMEEQRLSGATPLVVLDVLDWETDGTITIKAQNRGSGPAIGGEMSVDYPLLDYDAGFFDLLDPGAATNMKILPQAFIPIDRMNFPNLRSSARGTINLTYRDLYGRYWESPAEFALDFTTADDFANSKDWDKTMWYMRQPLVLPLPPRRLPSRPETRYTIHPRESEPWWRVWCRSRVKRVKPKRK